MNRGQLVVIASLAVVILIMAVVGYYATQAENSEEYVEYPELAAGFAAIDYCQDGDPIATPPGGWERFAVTAGWNCAAHPCHDLNLIGTQFPYGVEGYTSHEHKSHAWARFIVCEGDNTVVLTTFTVKAGTKCNEYTGISCKLQDNFASVWLRPQYGSGEVLDQTPDGGVTIPAGTCERFHLQAFSVQQCANAQLHIGTQPSWQEKGFQYYNADGGSEETVQIITVLEGTDLHIDYGFVAKPTHHVRMAVDHKEHYSSYGNVRVFQGDLLQDFESHLADRRVV